MSFLPTARMLLGAGVLCACMPVAAQTTETPELFAIEAIVFVRNTEDPAAAWHLNAPPPDLTGARELGTSDQPAVPRPERLLLTDAPPLYTELPAEQLAMTTAWERLARNTRFTPLVHVAWHQFEEPFGAGVPVRVSGGDVLTRRNPGSVLWQPINDETRTIDGTITFSKGRFLHLAVDLVYRRPTRVAGALGPLVDFTDSSIAPVAWRNYSLQQRRQIRTNELLYFDHPLFGVLVRVSRPEEDDG